MTDLSDLTDLTDRSPARPSDAARCIVAGSVPYAWPWDGALAGDRLALLLPGNDPAWRAVAPLEDGDRRRLDQTVDAVRAAGGIVVRVCHPSAPGRTHADGGATPAAAAPEDDRDDRHHRDDHTVHAAGLDGFYGSRLDSVLRTEGRDQLVLAGWGLEGPVHSTMRSANDQGYECLLLTDAVGAITPGTREPALSMVTMSGGIFGALGTTAALCAALASLSPDPAAS